MAQVKIAVVANCQARPVAALLKQMSPKVEIAGFTITHLAKEAQREAAFELYEKADFVFAQAVNENYPVSFLRTVKLKDAFGDKIITWPNAFFRGHCPDIRYLTIPGEGRAMGPLGHYHSLAIYDAWRNERGAMRTVKMLRQEDEWTQEFEGEPNQSIQELRDREASLDIKLADYIEERWREERLFYTFNHPKKKVLIQLAAGLLKRISVSSQRSEPVGDDREPLGKTVPLLMPRLAERIGLKFEPNEWSKGVTLTSENKLGIEGTPRFYKLKDLIETSFKCYDIQLNPDTELRVS